MLPFSCCTMSWLFSSVSPCDCWYVTSETGGYVAETSRSVEGFVETCPVMFRCDFLLQQYKRFARLKWSTETNIFTKTLSKTNDDSRKNIDDNAPSIKPVTISIMFDGPAPADCDVANDIPPTNIRAKLEQFDVITRVSHVAHSTHPIIKNVRAKISGSDCRSWCFLTCVKEDMYRKELFDNLLLVSPFCSRSTVVGPYTVDILLLGGTGTKPLENDFVSTFTWSIKQFISLKINVKSYYLTPVRVDRVRRLRTQFVALPTWNTMPRKRFIKIQVRTETQLTKYEH